MKESKTAYAYLIEHMQNPSFFKVWDIAYDFVQKLPYELCDELHEALNRGVDVLDSEPLLQMYIYAFGKMHNAKLQHAFNKLQDRVVKSNQIEIVDYGCGQGLASICYHDFIKEHNPQQQVTKITLIEPSSLALSRAELLCSCFYPNAEIIAVNKSFDELTTKDIKVSPEVLTLHLFSNILDVESYNLQHLIQIVTSLKSEKNEYVVVSPIQNARRTHRLKAFTANLNGHIYYENYLEKRHLDEERDWTCAVLLCSDRTKQEIIASDCDKIFEEAVSFIENKNNDWQSEHSIELFRKLHVCAELGDKRCQNQLGIWYLKGIGTEQNVQLAIEWYQKSAEQKYAAALFNLGNMYYNGEGVKQDFHKAVEYYTIGADENYPDCQLELGLCYFYGVGIEQNYKTAFQLFKKAIEQRNDEATYYLWKCYFGGYGVEKDEKLAIAFLKKAIKLQIPEAYYGMAMLCQSGKLLEKDEKKALNLFKKSAKLGYDRAQERLGEIFKNGELGMEESPKKSFNWFLKAAEQGIASAQFYIGYFYANGYGVNKDVKLAFDWYSKAAEQNNAAALNNLAVCYRYGRGTMIDLAKAIYYYEKSANLGNVTAQKNLAICYKNGTGVELNPSKVFYWTLEAANNGDIDSQGKIALYHFKGYGTDQDNAEALLWYARYYSENNHNHICNANDAFSFLQEKANEGDSQALYMIGKCLQYGVANDKNIRNAYTYYGKAAELGHIESMIKTHQISSLYDYCSAKDDENSYKDACGVKYSKDKKILIDSRYLKRGEYQIAKGTRIICDSAFRSGDIEKVIIPSSVIAIGKNPFAKTKKSIECHSAEFVVSGFALYTKDKKKLISYFGSDSKVTIPDGVEIIGSKAFVENENLLEIEFPESLRSIENAAFKYCLRLSQISLPKNVRQIGEQCFYGCESLKNIMALGEINKICKEAFYGCNIKELSLPESLIEIDDNAFNSNRNLDSITLPVNVKRIGNSSFAYCSIKHIYLNDDLQEIGDFCFFECPIESIVIPSNVKYIGINPFIGAKIIECKNNCRYVAENGLLYNKESGNLISHYNETEVALYPPISRVNSFAFYNSDVTDIFIGNNIVKVAPWAFYNAHKLEKVIWRTSKITEIPKGCFGKCSKICKIDIPSCVENVHKGAFFDCYDLKIIRFDGLNTMANEEMFCRVERSSGVPYSYSPRHPLPPLIKGLITTSMFRKKEGNSSTFPLIEIIIPHGCAKNYSFPPIYDSNMNRRFIIKEDEKE